MREKKPKQPGALWCHQPTDFFGNDPILCEEALKKQNKVGDNIWWRYRKLCEGIRWWFIFLIIIWLIQWDCQLRCVKGRADFLRLGPCSTSLKIARNHLDEWGRWFEGIRPSDNWMVAVLGLTCEVSIKYMSKKYIQINKSPKSPHSEKKTHNLITIWLGKSSP